MSVRKTALVVAIGFVSVFSVVGLFASPRFFASASIEVRAPISHVFRTASNLALHPLWSARKRRDPSVRFSFSSKAPIGPGAYYEWTSDADEGGRCTIIESVTNRKLLIHVSLGRRGEGDTEWTFTSTNDATRVTRRFSGRVGVPILGSWIVLVADPGASLSKDFEQELEMFRVTAEAKGAK